MNELSNTVSATGDYNSIATSITSNVLVVSMIDGLTITKSADKMVWADGLLTYTITINNKTDQTYSNIKVSDTLDISLVSFVDSSIYVNGSKIEDSKYTYVEGSGLLTIDVDDIAPSGESTITFQVKKKE